MWRQLRRCASGFTGGSGQGRPGPSRPVDSGPAKYLVLLAPGTAFALGVWQIKRKAWKESLIAQMESRLHTAPIPLDSALLGSLDPVAMEFQPLLLRGHFQHARELLIRPRVYRKDGGGGGGGLISGGGVVGSHVLTPFRLDSGETVLVNRGWVPRNLADAATRAEGNPEGRVQIVAVLRRSEPRPRLVAENDFGKGLMTHRDVEGLAAHCGTLPVYLEADLDTAIPGGPVGGQSNVALRNEHLSYIFTWFTLGGITSWMWFKHYFRPPRL